MPHARRQIREAAAAALAGSVTVEMSRQYPTTEAQMPRYLVYTIAESIEPGMSTPGALARELSLVVEAIMVGDEATVDDDLDAHAVFIESRLSRSNLGGLVLKTDLTQSELAIRTDGDRSLGVLTLTFAILYRTLPTNPETIT